MRAETGAMVPRPRFMAVVWIFIGVLLVTIVSSRGTNRPNESAWSGLSADVAFLLPAYACCESAASGSIRIMIVLCECAVRLRKWLHSRRNWVLSMKGNGSGMQFWTVKSAGRDNAVIRSTG